ncbi:hypothetical protein MRX96_020680 [Rhipicephalus microplus]
MAFADDIILTASTKAGLQCQLNSLNRYLKERGLQANADKSRTLTILPSGRDKKAKVDTEHIYTIGDNPITVTSHTSVWKYLGIHFDGTQASNNTVRGDLKVLLLRLSKAPLKPQQRMVALRTYLITRLIHRLVLGPVSSKLLKSFDAMVRGTVRKWLNLPQDVTLGFFYAPIPEGGLGVMCLRSVIPALRLRRLRSSILSSHFQCAVAAGKDFVRRAIRQAEGLAVFRGDNIDSSTASRRFWTRILHQSYDGRPLSRCADVKGSTAWIGEGTTFLKGKEYVDLIKFHIAAIPNLTRLKRGQDVLKKCRAGCNADESLGHVLQRNGKVREEPHYRTSQGNRIPDLVLSRDGQCVVLDVQVVGTRVDLSEAHEAKRRKYLIPDMLMHITSETGARSYPTVSSITLTYRGTWASESTRILLDLGLGRQDIKVATIRCLQGGLRAFRVHQRSTSVHNRRDQHGLE